MRSGDKTEFINRLKTPDLISRNGRFFVSARPNSDAYG